MKWSKRLQQASHLTYSGESLLAEAVRKKRWSIFWLAVYLGFLLIGLVAWQNSHLKVFGLFEYFGLIGVGMLYDEQQLEALGYLPPKETSITLTVSGLTNLVSSADEISATQKQEFLDNSLSLIKADYDEDMLASTATSVVAPEVYNAYLLTAIDMNNPHIDYTKGILNMYSGVAVIGHYTVKTTGLWGMTTDNWYIKLYVNCAIDEAGNITYAEEVESFILDAVDESDVFSWMKDEFDKMKIVCLIY